MTVWQTQPLVSVIIPTYNCGELICAAVDSVLAQTYPRVEIIVVDDGSTDDTRTRVQIYGDRIHYVRQENGGISRARNAGITIATGEFIALLDADDLWHPQKLARQMLVHRDNLSILMSGAIAIAFKPPTLASSFSGEPRYSVLSISDLVSGATFGSASGAVVHRKCFDAVGLFDESFRAAEDFELWLRLLEHFKLAKVLEPLIYIRTRPGSWSGSALLMLENHRKALRKSFIAVPSLRVHWSWRRILTSRLYRETSWAFYQNGQRVTALQTLLVSILCWPFPIPEVSTPKRPLLRLKLLIRYCLPVRNDGA